MNMEIIFGTNLQALRKEKKLKQSELGEKLNMTQRKISYLENGKAYFGELTFTPSGGFDTGRLPESDRLFGSMVKLK